MSYHLPESFLLASILAEQCVCTRKDSELEWLAKDNPETNPTTIKPETWPQGRVLLGPLTLLLSTWAPLSNKISCFVSTRVSADNSFLSIRQEPTLGPWKGSSFLQHFHEMQVYVRKHIKDAWMSNIAGPARRFQTRSMMHSCRLRIKDTEQMGLRGSLQSAMILYSSKLHLY